jgi:light-regulated signal transduction histidine kinase (bacteriophytochrome)
MLRNIGNFFPGPVFVYGLEPKTIHYANDLFVEALGHSRIEVDTRELHIDEVILADDQELFERGIALCAGLKASAVHSFACRVRLKSDLGVHWELTGRVLQRNEQGQAESILIFAKDIHDEVHHASETRELERKISDLRRSNKDLEEFAYIASHDMHEPLRKVHSFADRLKSKYSVSAEGEAKDYLDRILAATQNARLMIDGLMEFSRLSRNGFGFETVNMNDLVLDVLSDLELKIEETDTQVDVGQLPQIEVIPIQMKQLFTNLILNAIKFQKEGTAPLLNIQARKLEDGERSVHHLDLPSVYYQFTITDNGIGFEEEYAETIFQMFQRLNGKSEYPGSGIGLALCKKITDNHHGTIAANSTPGEGTVITVILPVKNNP